MALAFTGTSRITHGNGATINNFSAFTMIVWIRPHDTSTGDVAVKINGSVGKSCYRVGLKPALYVSRTTESEAETAADTLIVGRWSLVAWTFNTTAGIGIYVGDEATSPVAQTLTVVSAGSGSVGSENPVPLYIGNNPGSSGPALSDIAAVAYFSRVLTAEEITRVWLDWNQARNFAPALLAEYAATGVQTDYSGNPNHGTVTGATLVAHPTLYPAALDTRWLGLLEAAAGGNIYNETLAFAASGGLTPTPFVTFNAGMSFGASGGVAPGSLATMGGTVQFGANAGAAAASLLQMLSALALGASSGASLGGSNRMSASSAFGTSAGMSDAAKLTMPGAISIGAQGGMSAQSLATLVASFQAAIRAAVSAGTGNAFSESLTFGARSGASLSSVASLAAAIAINAQAGCTSQVAAHMTAAIAPSAVLGFAAGYGAIFQESLTMGARGGAQAVAHHALNAAISLAGSFGISESSMLEAACSLPFPSQLGTALGATVEASEALSFLARLGLSIQDLANLIAQAALVKASAQRAYPVSVALSAPSITASTAAAEITVRTEPVQ